MSEKVLIRHFLKTIRYRGMKYLGDFGPNFSSYSAGKLIRSAAQILNHINGLLLYSQSCFEKGIDTCPTLLTLTEEVMRFGQLVAQLERTIIEKEPIRFSYKQILQGPLADIMLHIGEISMLRQVAGDPADDMENYIEAEI